MDEYNKGFDRALKFISKRLKTEAEIRNKLKAYCSEEIIEKVITRLKELGYVNDELYVSCYIRDRIKFNPMGKFRIKKELEARGVSKIHIENNAEYNNIDEISLIKKILNKRLKGHGLSECVDMRRLTGYLARRGFSYQNINRVLGQHDDLLT